MTRSPIEAMIDSAVRCTCCSATMAQGCSCWLKYGVGFKRKAGQYVYKCKKGCWQCSLHCKHSKHPIKAGKRKVA